MFDDIFDTYWDNKDRYCINAKKQRTRENVLYMLDRTQEMFVWKGLPKTIKPRILETYFQTHGNVCLTEVLNIPEGINREKGLYIFFGGLGGMLDENYEPTIYTVANPYLNFSECLEIGKDCVRGRNDRHGVGLLPLFMKYGSMMNENEVSMNMLSICYRIDNLISADDDRTYESAKQYFNDIIDGQFGAISSSEFFDGIRNEKTSGSTRSIKDLIEYEQYLKASWYNEIGLNSNYNMKRERMVASESQMNDDALIPLVDNMIKCRNEFIEETKELYGDKYDLSELSVELNPIWDLDHQYYGMIPEDITDEEVEEDLSEEETEGTEEPEGTEDEPEETTEEEPEVSERSENEETEIETDAIEDLVKGVAGIVEEVLEGEEMEEGEENENNEVD